MNRNEYRALEIDIYSEKIRKLTEELHHYTSKMAKASTPDEILEASFGARIALEEMQELADARAQTMRKWMGELEEEFGLSSYIDGCVDATDSSAQNRHGRMMCLAEVFGAMQPLESMKQ